MSKIKLFELKSGLRRFYKERLRRCNNFNKKGENSRTKFWLGHILILKVNQIDVIILTQVFENVTCLSVYFPI